MVLELAWFPFPECWDDLYINVSSKVSTVSLRDILPLSQILEIAFSTPEQLRRTGTAGSELQSSVFISM